MAKTQLIQWFNRIKKLANIRWILCLFVLALALLCYAEFKESAQEKSTETVSEATYTHTETEIKLASALESIPNVGKTEIFIGTDSDKNIGGVIVTCEGANNPTVRLTVKQAVKTALQIDDRRIKIYEKKD